MENRDTEGSEKLLKSVKRTRKKLNSITIKLTLKTDKYYIVIDKSQSGEINHDNQMKVKINGKAIT